MKKNAQNIQEIFKQCTVHLLYLEDFLIVLYFPYSGRNLQGLGTAISKGLDIDWNGYNDFAVGAPGSAQALVFRWL